MLLHASLNTIPKIKNPVEIVYYEIPANDPSENFHTRERRLELDTEQFEHGTSVTLCCSPLIGRLPCNEPPQQWPTSSYIDYECHAWPDFASSDLQLVSRSRRNDVKHLTEVAQEPRSLNVDCVPAAQCNGGAGCRVPSDAGAGPRTERRGVDGEIFWLT